MALPETLECLSSLLEEGGSVCLYERGDYQTVPRHPDFRFCIIYTSNLRLGAVFRIQIQRIQMFLGHPDPDPLFRGMDPDPVLYPDTDPSIIMQK